MAVRHRNREQAQHAVLAALLREHGGITDERARVHGITSLRRRVYDLRRQGWRISTCNDPAHAQRGHYVLDQAPDEAPRQTGLGL